MEHQVVQTRPDVELPVHIYQAATQGRADVVKQSLRDHPEYINARTDFNYTLLDAACINQQVFVLEILLEYSNIELNVKYENGQTPLVKYIIKDKMDAVKVLIASCKQDVLLDPCIADINGNCSLWLLVERSRWDLIPGILGPNLNGYSTSMLEDTLEMARLAAQYHIVEEIAQYLINKSFHEKKWKDLRRYLKKQGRLYSAEDAIISAVYMNDFHIIKDLIKDQIFSPTSFDTAIDLAIWFDRTQVIGPLLEHHSKCDIAVLKKSLDALVEKNSLSLIEVLLKHHMHKFNYESLCQARAKAKAHGFEDAKDFLHNALKSYCINYEKRLSNCESAYKNSSNPRGIVYIFNYINTRPGAEYDSENIKHVFESFGYKVVNYTNLTKSQTINTIDGITCDPELCNVDSMIMFILSHGKSKYEFAAVDGEIINLERDIRSKFTNDLCPNLKNKPKIFLPNYCRTKQMICERPTDYDLPTRNLPSSMLDAKFVSQLSLEENPPEENALRVPSYIEILRDAVTIHATTDGISALRETNKGTIFIYSLCDVLKEVPTPRELMHVYRKLHEKMKENKGTTPEFEGVLSKLFYFTPDGNESE